MDYIKESNAETWNKRIKDLMKREGYTQETFCKEFKKKYGNCTQTNISRWCRVGDAITDKSGSIKKIGFPSYETMKKIADFFRVSVGYLIGETDFETFDMEKACEYLCIDEITAKSIREIVNGASIEHLGYYLANEYRNTFRYLVTAESFPEFIKKLRELAEKIHRKNNPVDYYENAVNRIDKEIINVALQCIDYSKGYDENYCEIDDFKDNNVQLTEELIETIKILRRAREKEDFQASELELNVRMSKYELLETYFKVIEEALAENHLSDMVVTFIE